MQTNQRMLRVASALLIAMMSMLAIGCAAATGSGTGQSLTAAAQASSEVSEATLRRGSILFLQCRACHSTESGGEHKVGPNLHGLIGAPAAGKDAFIYSEALQAAEIVWTEQTLDEFLTAPNDLVAGTIMAFPGIPGASDRQALIAFLIAQTN